MADKAYHALQIIGKKLRSLSRSSRHQKATGDYRDKLLLEQEEQLALANTMSSIVLSSSDLQELCEGFARELAGLIPIEWAAIGLIDSARDTLLLSPLSEKISSDWELGDSIPLTDTPVLWMVKNQQAILEPDLKKEAKFYTGYSLLRQKIRAVVYMPFFSRKEVFGGLIIGSEHPDVYRERELKLLKYATTQLAVAIENNRLFRESGDGLEREAEFILTLMHELRTPLTPIRASGELLTEELQFDMQSHHAKLAENILRSAHTLDSKISEMLELAKVQSPNFKLQTRSVDIWPLIQDVAAQLKPVAQEKGQLLEVKLPSSLPMVKADYCQLSRIVHNLLSNAILISPQDVSIDLSVSVKKQDKEMVISVKDFGDGFMPEEQKHLFEVYHIPDADRKRFLELRLKLVICKRLVELHKGRIWVESREGKGGNTFYFTLPVY